MKNKIEEIKKEYWEEVNKINREVPKHTSRIHKFGYKYKLGHIFITVTDFGNIWSFIDSALKEQQKETFKEIRNNFVEIAIRGKNDRDELKGVILYQRTLNYLDDIIKYLKGVKEK